MRKQTKWKVGDRVLLTACQCTGVVVATGYNDYTEVVYDDAPGKIEACIGDELIRESDQSKVPWPKREEPRAKPPTNPTDS